jgi:hypothetical protein
MVSGKIFLVTPQPHDIWYTNATRPFSAFEPFIMRCDKICGLPALLSNSNGLMP